MSCHAMCPSILLQRVDGCMCARTASFCCRNCVARAPNVCRPPFASIKTRLSPQQRLCTTRHTPEEENDERDTCRAVCSNRRFAPRDARLHLRFGSEHSRKVIELLCACGAELRLIRRFECAQKFGGCGPIACTEVVHAYKLLSAVDDKRIKQ